MPIIAKETGSGPKELPPPDVHNAVCAFVEDVGVQPGFQGNPPRHKVIICWELEERMSDGKPFMLSKRYTLSLHEKAVLRRDLESWRGKPFTPEELDGFDLEKLKGANCRINVVHQPKADGGFRAVVQSVIKPAQGVKLAPVNTEPPAWIAEDRKKAIQPPQAQGQNEEQAGDFPADW